MQPQSPKGLRFLFYVLILIKMLMETFLDMCYYMHKALYFWQFFSIAASAVSASLIRRSKRNLNAFLRFLPCCSATRRNCWDSIMR